MAKAPSSESVSSLPLHRQIRDTLLADISSGRYKPGDRIPTESELMAQLRVSRATVRRALYDLARDGVLNRQPARGTFVAESKIEQDLSGLTGFVEDMQLLGLKPTSRVLEVRMIRSSGDVAEKLQIEQGAEVLRIQRVRMADDEPISFDVSYLPKHIGERVATEDLAIQAIYSLLEDKYGVALGEAEYWIEAHSVDRAIAQHLGIRVGSPIFLIDRTTYSSEGVPVDYEKMYYRGDKIRYRLRLRRQRPELRLLEPERLPHRAT